MKDSKGVHNGTYTNQKKKNENEKEDLYHTSYCACVGLMTHHYSDVTLIIFVLILYNLTYIHMYYI